MSNCKIKRELRKVASKLRTKPIPLKDIIPLLQKAADALENTTHVLADFYDTWEDGVYCYDDGSGAFLGRAVDLSDEAENDILELIKVDPEDVEDSDVA